MKSEATNSPRTNAGISKSLLTPCRRLGLTRRRATASPLTPLYSSTAMSSTPSTQEQSSGPPNEHHGRELKLSDLNVSTPPRSLPQPRRHPSKKLLAKIAIPDSPRPVNTPPENEVIEIPSPKKFIVENESSDPSDEVGSNIIPVEETENKANEKIKIEQKIMDNVEVQPTRKRSFEHKTPTRPRKQKSFNLKKNCMVVLDNHLLKPQAHKNCSSMNDETTNKLVSMCIDTNAQKGETDTSDVDDIPLSEVSKKNNNSQDGISGNVKKQEISGNVKKQEISGNVKKRMTTLSDEESDFCEKSLSTFPIKTEKTIKRSKLAKLDSSKGSSASSSGEVKKNAKEQCKIKNSSIAIGSESEDEDFHCRKTILVRKSYPKVSLQKAKSTGSITQKDIDDIKVRIRMKQNALIAKAGGQNLEELTELIKRWRKGCQEALMELLEIMKRKVPEKQNMNTEQLLKMLNIPPALVHYNSDDDYFVSPE